MSDGGLLFHLFIALGTALAGAAIAVTLRQSTVLGYLLAGMAVGPFTPGFVAPTPAITDLAEVGVVIVGSVTKRVLRGVARDVLVVDRRRRGRAE